MIAAAVGAVDNRELPAGTGALYAAPWLARGVAAVILPRASRAITRVARGRED